MFEHAEVLNTLLSHSRGLLDDKAVAENDGFQVYVISLDALDFVIEAKRSSKVSYTYIIRTYDRKFKRYSSTPYSHTNPYVHTSPTTKMPVPFVPSASSLQPRVVVPKGSTARSKKFKG